MNHEIREMQEEATETHSNGRMIETREKTRITGTIETTSGDLEDIAKTPGAVAVLERQQWATNAAIVNEATTTLGTPTTEMLDVRPGIARPESNNSRRSFKK